MKQQSLFNEKTVTEFGGSLLKKGKRKSARPLNLKAPIHLVLKANDCVQLFRHSQFIKLKFDSISRRFGVKVYSLAAHDDHIHAVVKFPSRRLYRAWIRALTGVLCRAIKGLKWRLRPFTKILTWGKQFKTTLAYLKANEAEADFIERAWDHVQEFEKETAGIAANIPGWQTFRERA